MKKFLVRMLILGMMVSVSCAMNAQVKYIFLGLSQPKVNGCVTNIDNMISNSDLKLFPNPSKGVFTIEINNKSLEIIVDLVIYDVTGKEILNQQLNLGEKNIETIDLTNFKRGIYILNISDRQNAAIKAKVITY